MDNIDVTRFSKYFMRKQYDLISKNNSYHKKKNRILNKFDKLFFNILVILDINTPYEYTYNFQKNKKIEILENIISSVDAGKIKIKPKHVEVISENLMYKEYLDVITFKVICMVFKLNVIFIYKKSYIRFINNPITEKVYYFNDKYDYYERKEENDMSNYYEIENCEKILYSITNYKVDDLYTISSKLDIEFPDKIKKADMYKSIKSYFEFDFFNNNK